jgi:hypothetical protein
MTKGKVVAACKDSDWKPREYGQQGYGHGNTDAVLKRGRERRSQRLRRS